MNSIFKDVKVNLGDLLENLMFAYEKANGSVYLLPQIGNTAWSVELILPEEESDYNPPY